MSPTRLGGLRAGSYTRALHVLFSSLARTCTRVVGSPGGWNYCAPPARREAHRDDARERRSAFCAGRRYMCFACFCVRVLKPRGRRRGGPPSWINAPKFSFKWRAVDGVLLSLVRLDLWGCDRRLLRGPATERLRDCVRSIESESRLKSWKRL